MAGGERLRLFGVGGAVHEEKRRNSQCFTQRPQEELRQCREEFHERDRGAPRPQRQDRARLLRVAMCHSHQLSDASHRLVFEDCRAQSAAKVLPGLWKICRFEVSRT